MYRRLVDNVNYLAKRRYSNLQTVSLRCVAYAHFCSPLIKCILKREHTKTKAEVEAEGKGEGEEAESSGVDVIGVTETEESLSFNWHHLFPLLPPMRSHAYFNSLNYARHPGGPNRSIDESFFHYIFA